jgi:hypothetical protein
MDGLSFATCDKKLAKMLYCTAYIDILVKSLDFTLSVSQIEQLQTWMKLQQRLMDGCIEFNFCPCSMGLSLIVSNSLTKDTIDLTEYK